MGFSGFSSRFLNILALSSVISASLSSISIVGTKFFDEDGKQFFFKGVAYQQENTNSSSKIKDPLADPESCKRDAPLMKEAGLNLIRTYAIDPTLSHKECISEFESNGIYIISDLSAPEISINRDDPSWDVSLFDHYTSVIDALAPYSNVIGFFAGNEVSNNITNSAASAFVKAAVRDMKAFVAQKNYKNKAIGYAANDDPLIRVPLGQYFTCGNETDRVDVMGSNLYSWCQKSTIQESGYDKRAEVTTISDLTDIKEFSKFPVPTILSEIGCNLGGLSRPFTEIEAIYSDQLTPVLSGCVVYMYFQEENNYGLVDISNNQVSPRQDYYNLKDELAKVNPTRENKNSYKPSSSLLECPSDPSSWPVSNTLPPTPNKDLCSCMTASLSCVVADSVNSEDYGALFGQACGTASCDGIHANSTSGQYGAYSMCAAKDKLSFALNQYYKKQNFASTACDFKGQAKVQTPAKADGTCKTLLSQAGTDGTGNVKSSISGSSKESTTTKNSAILPKVNLVLTASWVLALGIALVS